MAKSPYQQFLNSSGGDGGGSAFERFANGIETRYKAQDEEEERKKRDRVQRFVDEANKANDEAAKADKTAKRWKTAGNILSAPFRAAKAVVTDPVGSAKKVGNFGLDVMASGGKHTGEMIGNIYGANQQLKGVDYYLEQSNSYTTKYIEAKNAGNLEDAEHYRSLSSNYARIAKDQGASAEKLLPTTKQVIGNVGELGLDVVNALTLGTVGAAGQGVKLTGKQAFKAGAKEALKYGTAWGTAGAVTQGLREDKNAWDIAKSVPANVALNTAMLGAVPAAQGATRLLKDMLPNKNAVNNAVVQEMLQNIPKKKANIDELIPKFNTEFKTGKKNFQQFDAANNKSIITLTKNAKKGTVWHEVAHAVDRQNPELRAKLEPEIINLTGSKNVSNEDFGNAFRKIIKDPNLRVDHPQIADVIDNISLPSEMKKKFNLPEPVEAASFLKDRSDAKKFYKVYGYSREGDIQPVNAGLRTLEDQANTPMGVRAAKEEVEDLIRKGKIKLNDDNTLTVYRGGPVVKENKLASVSLSKEAAQEFGDVTEHKIKPSQIKVASGLDPDEMLVELPKPKAKVEIVKPKPGSTEQIIESKEGWKPGTKAQFDKAVIDNDRATVEKLLPDVPKKYQTQFKTEINDIMGNKKIPKDLLDTEQSAQIYEELASAEAGKRHLVVDEVTGERSVLGQKSSFPDWVPENLRSRKLFDGVQDHMVKGTVPTNKKSLELYEVVRDEVLSRNKPIKVIDKAYQNTIDNGGVTINLNGRQPRKGFAFSPYKDVETIVKKEDFKETHIDNFIQKHYDKLNEKGNHLGIWEDDGNIYLDISQVGKPDAKTIKIAEDAKQLAVFDLDSFETIPTRHSPDWKGSKHETSDLFNHNRGENSRTNPEGIKGSAPEVPEGQPATPKGSSEGPKSGVNTGAAKIKGAPEGFTIDKYYKGDETSRYGRKVNTQAINTVEDIQILNQDLNNKYLKVFQDVKGGRKGHEETLKQAEALGWTYDEIKKIPDGALLNAAQMAAVRQVKADFTLELAEVARSYKKNPNQELLGKMNDLVSKIVQVEATAKRAETYLGRAIEIKRATPIPREFDDSIMSILDKAGVTGVTDLKSATRASQKITEASIGDMYWSAYYGSILSGPTTHAKNIQGSGLNTVAEQALEAMRHPTNIPNQLKAVGGGVVDGWKSFRDIMTGKEGYVSKYDLSKPGPKNWLIDKFEYVGRTLAAEDAFFKKINEKSSISSLAYEAAKKEGYGMITAPSRVQYFIDNPTSEMADQAVKEALRNTYNQKPEGWVGAVVTSWGNALQKAPVLRFVQPFAKVVGNVLNAGIDWSPLGLKRAVQYKRAGGEFANREFHQQIGRVVLGTMGMVEAYSMAQAGNLTGSGPSDPSLRKQMQERGWQPNSVKIGDKYISYLNFGPFGIPLALTANYVEGKKYAKLDDKGLDERFAYSFFGAVNTVMDMSFLSSLQSLTKAIQYKDEKYLKKFLTNPVTSIYPNLFKQIGNLFEDTKKDPKTTMDYLINNLGYPFRKGLDPQLDVFGKPIEDKRPIWSRVIGTSVQSEKKDELSDLLTKMTDKKVNLPIPTYTTTIKEPGAKESRKMTETELREYKKIFGAELEKRLKSNKNNLMRLEGDNFENKVDSILADARDYSKKKLLSKKIPKDKPRTLLDELGF